MDREQAENFMKVLGFAFVTDFMNLKNAVGNGHENHDTYIERMDSIWKKVSCVQIEDNEATIATVYQLMHWFFYPAGDPDESGSQGRMGYDIDYEILVMNLLHDRLSKQYPSVERALPFHLLNQSERKQYMPLHHVLNNGFVV